MENRAESKQKVADAEIDAMETLGEQLRITDARYINCYIYRCE